MNRGGQAADPDSRARRGIGSWRRTTETGSAATPDLGSDVALLQLTELTKHAREEISRADTKASLQLAVAGVFAGSAVGAMAACGWSPFTLSGVAEVLFWLASGALTAGVLLVASATLPQRGSGSRRPFAVSYFGDVVTASKCGSLEQHLATDIGQLKAQMVSQLEQLARIADSKYRRISLGLGCLFGGVILSVGTFLLAALT
jgi:hypothetical protein